MLTDDGDCDWMFSNDQEQDDLQHADTGSDHTNSAGDGVLGQAVLQPEHPLLQQFQLALRQFLLQETSRLDEETKELRSSLKAARKRQEERLSQQTHALEVQVQQQRALLQEYESNLQAATQHRGQKQQEGSRVREGAKEHKELVQTQQYKEVELRCELEALLVLSGQYQRWQEEADQQLAVQQRMQGKVTRDKRELAKQQKEKDLSLLVLSGEVSRLESRLSLLQEHAAVKRGELCEAGLRGAQGEAACGALRREQQRLLQAWGALLVHVQHRDATLASVAEAHRQVLSECRTLAAGMESLKKETLAEMSRHEQLMTLRTEQARNMQNTTREVELSEEQGLRLQTQVQQLRQAHDITQGELNNNKQEQCGLLSRLSGVCRELEQLSEQRGRLEAGALQELQERLSADKAAQTLANTAHKLKQQARTQEMMLLQLENQQARLCLQLERRKSRNVALQDKCREREGACGRRGDRLAEGEARDRELMGLVTKYTQELRSAQDKLNLLKQQTLGSEISPLEQEEQSLRAQQVRLRQQAHALQQEWMRQQDRAVTLTQQHAALTGQAALQMHQIKMLDHKHMKLVQALEQSGGEEREVQRGLEAQQARLQQLYAARGQQQQLTTQLQAQHTQQALLAQAKLQDAADSATQLEQEIEELEEQKEQLVTRLYQANREARTWQKEGILATETKHEVDEERGMTGEVGRMKLEIHRMEVRQAQLLRAGRRLSCDLVHAVGRREAVALRARASAPKGGTQLNPKRRALPARTRDKKQLAHTIHQEVESARGSLSSLQQQLQQLQERLQEQREREQQALQEMDTLAETRNNKQQQKLKNLERIISLQQEARLWEGLVGGRSRPPNSSHASALQGALLLHQQLHHQLNTALKTLND